MYSLFKPLLFLLDPELAHQLSLECFDLLHRLRLLKPATIKARHVSLLNLNFPNQLGLAAGLDKNADYIDALSTLGFGFMEIGTVTPRPQAGNPKPRLFRLPRDKAIINRMGFNSKGADYVARQLQTVNYQGILGINIGKNRDTPNDRASDDYLYSFRKLWPYASYIVINISSPNTANLRELQDNIALDPLLKKLKEEQKRIDKEHGKYIPLLVKVAPDLTPDAVQSIAESLKANDIDGLIATNTTIARNHLQSSSLAHERGGLSGKPLQHLSTDILKQFRQCLPDSFPIIASGGVMDQNSLSEKLSAGADLVQVYTGLIYSGPALVKQLASYPS